MRSGAPRVTESSATSFDAVFKLLTGYDPMPWQRRLYAHFCAGDYPGSIDIPTGLGKTSVMDIWWIARNHGASVPRRLVYVVDRRAVVDQATTEAERIADAALARGETLPISTLRGSLADNREWLFDPARQTIIVGTIDMIGSRLLFSGYGVSRSMRPFHAGLLGQDTLFVLDEVHLSPAFASLLEGIVSTGGSTIRVMALSATGPRRAALFQLQDDDRTHPVVQKRIHARKELAFAESSDPQDFASCAEDFAADTAARVIVFTTSRDFAAKVAALLMKTKKRTILIVGARRGYERDGVAQELEQEGFTGKVGGAMEPAFVVATAAGEVGIDLDADHMVCDLVSFERMVQRLGRVNRRGGRISRVTIFDLGETNNEEENARRALTLALFKSLPAAEGTTEGDPPNASSYNLMALRDAEPDRVQRASTPQPLRPPLTTPLVAAWSMTSLAEHTGRPDVAPWLRGWVDDEPQTIVVWRAQLPIKSRPDGASQASEVTEYFAAARIHLSERLQTETRNVVDWLGMKRGVAGQINALVAKQKVEAHYQPSSIVGLVLSQAMEHEAELRFHDLLDEGPNLKRSLTRTLAGRILVVDAHLGGLTVDGLLDASVRETPSTGDDGTWKDAGGHPVVGYTIKRHAVADLPKGRVLRSVPVRLDPAGDTVELLSVCSADPTEGDEDARSVAADPVTLDDHTQHVVAALKDILRRLGIVADEAKALILAAELHDEGKAASVWQKAMKAPIDGGPFAKTAGGNGRALGGYRHELGSLIGATENPRLASLSDTHRDLVLHLIAAHHGHARPVIRTDGCEAGPPSILARTAGDAALRFARLTAHYGAWGLAWREAILRAADQSASRAEAEGGGRGGE